MAAANTSYIFWGGGAPHFFDGRKTVLNCECNFFATCWSIAWFRLFRFWIFAAGEGDAEFVRFLFLPLEDVPLVFDEAGEGVGVSKAVRSCCLMVFGMLAVLNERFIVASEFKLILRSTFH